MSFTASSAAPDPSNDLASSSLAIHNSFSPSTDHRPTQPPSSDAHCHFHDLPDELIVAIFALTAAPAAVDARLVLIRVCARFRRLALDHAVWPCPGITEPWWNKFYNGRQYEEVIPPFNPNHLVLELNEVLIFIHAAWPDPTAPPPPLRLTLELNEGDAALLARAEASGFWHKSQSFGHVVGWAKLNAVKTMEAFNTIWQALAGPNLSCVTLSEQCIDPGDITTDHMPALRDYRSTCLDPYTPGGMKSLFCPGLERLFAVHLGKDRSPFTLSRPLPPEHTDSVSTLRRLFARHSFEIRAKNFPQLEALTVAASRPAHLGWRAPEDVPPRLRELTFYMRDVLNWVLEFWQSVPQLQTLAVVSADMVHAKGDLASAPLPAVKPGIVTYAKYADFEGRGFELCLRREPHPSGGESSQDTVWYRLRRL